MIHIHIHIASMRRPVLLSLLFAVLGAGCSADLEALYADEDALIALLPARPDDEVAAACGMCAKENCEQERLDCEQDELCSELLACKAPCDNPACLFECEAEHAARGEHNNYHTCTVDYRCSGDPDCVKECADEHQASKTYDAYRDCVFEEQCRGECATGENWQCLENYSWTPDDPGVDGPPRLTVSVKDNDSLLKPNPGAGGVRVYACLVSDLCASGRGVVTNASGIAILEDLPLDEDGAFRGYLQFTRDESADDGIAEIHDLGRPVYRELTMEEVVMPLSLHLDIIKGRTNVEATRDAGQISASVYDCLNAPAPGITFSIPSDRGGTRFYSNPSSWTVAKETDETGMGGFENVLIQWQSIFIEKPLMISATRSSDGVVVSEREVSLLAGNAVDSCVLNRVDLYPLAKTGSP